MFVHVLVLRLVFRDSFVLGLAAGRQPAVEPRKPDANARAADLLEPATLAVTEHSGTRTRFRGGGPRQFTESVGSMTISRVRVRVPADA